MPPRPEPWPGPDAGGGHSKQEQTRERWEEGGRVIGGESLCCEPLVLGSPSASARLTKHTTPAMNFNSNDNLVLVAPRPVRLASGAAPFPFHTPVAHRPRSRAALLSAAADAFDRLKLVEDHPDQQAELSDKDSLSPRPSPRYVSRSPIAPPR